MLEQASNVSAFMAGRRLGRDDASQAQAEYEGDRFVMHAEHRSADVGRAGRRSGAPCWSSRRLIDEHQFQRIEIELTVEPSPSPLKDVRAACSLACADFF